MDKIRLLVNARARGFTLLELVIAIAIVAILGVVLVPTFRGEREKLETKEFVAKLNTLMQAAWQQALSSQKVQRVFFDFNKKSIALSEQSDKDEKTLFWCVVRILQRKWQFLRIIISEIFTFKVLMKWAVAASAKIPGFF